MPQAGIAQDISSFYRAEYERFFGGLARLTPAEQERARQLALITGPPPGTPRTISLPGPGDVIHLAPRVPLDQQRVGQHFESLRRGTGPILNDAELSELARRRGVRERIRSSAQPEYAQGFGQVLTAIDNVQDSLITLAVVGRLIQAPFVALGDVLLPGLTSEAARGLAAREAGIASAAAFRAALPAALAAAEREAGILAGEVAIRQAALSSAEAAGAAAGRATYGATIKRLGLGFGSRILGRLIPGVGWVLLASDLLNLLGWVGQLAMPAYALVCHGPAEALAAGVPAAIFGRVLKPQTWNIHRLNPFSRISRAARQSAVLSRRIRFSDAIQVAQTTDQLWGRGVSLGALVGVVMESAYALEGLARGERTTVNLPQQGAAMRAVTQERLAQHPTTALGDLRRAAAVVGQAPTFLRTQATFTLEEHVEFLVAYSAALDLVSNDLRGRPWQPLAAEWFDVPLPPPGLAGPVTDQLIREVDPDAASLGRWALPGAPERVTADTLWAENEAAIPHALAELLRPERNTQYGGFYGFLVNRTADQLWLMLEDDPYFFRTQLAPQWRVMEQLIQVNRWVNNGQDEISIMRFWRTGEALLSDDHPRTYTGPEWDLLARQHGLTLIRMTPPNL